MSLENYLNKEEFKSFLLNEDDKKHDELVNKVFDFFKEKLNKNELNEIEYSDIHYTRFSNAWNKFVTNEIETMIDSYDKDMNIDEIKRFIFKIVLMEISTTKREYEKDNSEVNLDKLYSMFVSHINKGDFDTYETPSQDCYNCGAMLALKFKNWNAKFYEYKEILNPKEYRKVVPENSPASFLNKSDYFDANECFNEFIQVKELEVKTGELIITNWIKMEEFTKTVEVNGDIYHFSNSSPKGLKEQMEHYYQQGFLSFYSYSELGMISSKEKEFKDCMVIGHINEDEFNSKEYKQNYKYGSGLRAKTIIEKEKLIEIINIKVNDYEKSKSMVEDYIEKNKDEMIIKKVKPDIYHVVFDLRRKQINKDMFPLGIPKGISVDVIMYPKSKMVKNKKMKI